MPNAVAEIEPVVFTRAELIDLKARIFKIIVEMSLDKVTERDILILRELAKDTEILKELKKEE
jgi:hypothetical protein